MSSRSSWFLSADRGAWLRDAVGPSIVWWIIGASVASFATIGAIAASLTPPAVAIAEDDFTIAAILAVAGVIVYVTRSGQPFGRAMQLATFLALVGVGGGWYGARQWTRTRQLQYLFDRQTQQIRLNTVQLSANLVTFLRDRRRYVPPPPSAATWDEDERAITRFERETARLYDAKFSREVRAAHDLLALRGLRDRDLDLVYRRPADEFQIQTIALKLSLLARRLDRQ
jgi:hypothetical protein